MGMGPPVDEDDEIDFGGGGVPPVPDPPTFVAVGTTGATTTSFTLGLPAGILANDILLAVLESTAAGTPTIVTAGWVRVTIQTGSNTVLDVWWKRYADGDPGPTTDDVGDHELGVVLAFRGCVATGDPWDVLAGDTGTSSSTVTIPGAITTQPNTLVVAIAAEADDSSGEHFSAWANASLASIDERVDVSTALGGGGGIGIATGVKATAGAYGATTATLSAAASQARISIALRPA